MYQKFLKHINETGLVKTKHHILLAVSGGVDSMVMLYLFLNAKSDFNLKMSVGHYNHGLRGESADADEQLVQKFCTKNGVDFYHKKGEVENYAQKHKLSIEMAARECRYNFLQETAEKIGADLIATAHNANDQAETVLHHIIRGTGFTGLTGIPEKRDNIIRPILWAEKREIELFAQEKNIPFRFDESNNDKNFTRNKIRHEILPILKEVNPQIISSLNKLAAHAGEADEFLQFESEKALTHCIKQTHADKIILDIKMFLAYFNVLQKLMLRLVLEKLNNDPLVLNSEIFDQVLSLIKAQKSGAFFQIVNGPHFLVSMDELIVGKQVELPDIVTIENPGSFFLWDGSKLEILPTDKPLKEQLFDDSCIEYIDAERIVFPLTVRPVKDGDRFKPINFNGTKKVSDFFIDLKIPNYKRKQIPVLECKNKIVWICGHRLDHRFRITNTTKQAYKLKWTPSANKV